MDTLAGVSSQPIPSVGSYPVAPPVAGPGVDVREKYAQAKSGEIPSKKKGKTMIIVGIISIIVLVFIIAAGYVFYRSATYTPTNVRVTNVSSRSATISWETETASPGIVVYSETNDFLPSLLAGYGKDRAYDDRDMSRAELRASEKYAQDPENVEINETEPVSVDEKGSYYLHHVTVTSLDPQKTYYFLVGDGISFSAPESSIAADEYTAGEGNSFQTFAELSELAVPYPAYGSVTSVDGTVYDGVLYMIVMWDEGNRMSSPLSSVLNDQGRWYVDLSSVRSPSGEVVELDEAKDSEVVFVRGGTFGNSDQVAFALDEDAPAVSIELTKEVESRNPFISSAYAGQNCCYDSSWKLNGCSGDADWQAGYNACSNHECSICPSDKPQCTEKGQQCGSFGECCGQLYCANDETCQDAPQDAEEAVEVLENCTSGGQQGKCVRIADAAGCANLDRKPCGLGHGCCTAAVEAEEGTPGSECEGGGYCVPSDQSGVCKSFTQGGGCNTGLVCCIPPVQEPPPDPELASEPEGAADPFGDRSNDCPEVGYAIVDGGVCCNGVYTEGATECSERQCCCSYSVEGLIQYATIDMDDFGWTSCNDGEAGTCESGPCPEEKDPEPIPVNPDGDSQVPSLKMPIPPDFLASDVRAEDKNYTVTDDYILAPIEDGVYDVTIPGVGTATAVSMLENEVYVFFLDENGNRIRDEGEELLDLKGFSLQLTVDETKDAFTVSLTKGINFVAFEYLPDKTDSCELIKEMNGAELEMNVSLISRFESGAFQTTSYRADADDAVSGECFPVVPGRGYVIRAYVEKEVALAGYRLTSPAQVGFDAQGWHLIGVNGSGKIYTAESLIDGINTVEGLTSDNVTSWSSSMSRYSGLQKTGEQVYGFDFPIEPKVSYFVRVVGGSGVWTPE